MERAADIAQGLEPGSKRETHAAVTAAEDTALLARAVQRLRRRRLDHGSERHRGGETDGGVRPEIRTFGIPELRNSGTPENVRVSL